MPRKQDNLPLADSSEASTWEIEEVDMEVGFIIGSCCCSLDCEEEENDDCVDLTESLTEDELKETTAGGLRKSG